MMEKIREDQSVAWKHLEHPACKSLSFRLTSSLTAEASLYVDCNTNRLYSFSKLNWDENRKLLRFDVLAPSGKFLPKSFRNSNL